MNVLDGYLEGYDIGPQRMLANSSHPAYGNQAGGAPGFLSGAMSNPMLLAGMGMMGAAHDRRLNPFGGALQGLQMGMQNRRAEEQFKQQSDLLDLRKKSHEMEMRRLDAASKMGERYKKTLIAEAQALDSDGGPKITPREIKEIRRLIGVADYQIATGDVKGLGDLMAEERSAGPFKGTALEGQMLNRYLRNRNNPAWLQSPEGTLVQQYLARPKQFTTPRGVYETPGYDLNALGGAPKPDRTMHPSIPTERERTDAYVVDLLDRYDEEADNVLRRYPDFDPGSVTEGMRAIGGRAVQSPAMTQYQTATSEWASNLVFLRSGATARQEEVDRAIQNYFPKAGDDKDTQTVLALRRAQAVLSAAKKAFSEERLGPDEYQAIISRYEGKIRAFTPPEAVARLRANPSPEMQEAFERRYGWNPIK